MQTGDSFRWFDDMERFPMKTCCFHSHTGCPKMMYLFKDCLFVIAENVLLNLLYYCLTVVDYNIADYIFSVSFYFVLQWLNNLEKDSQYAYWPSNIEEVKSECSMCICYFFNFEVDSKWTRKRQPFLPDHDKSGLILKTDDLIINWKPELYSAIFVDVLMIHIPKFQWFLENSQSGISLRSTFLRTEGNRTMR